MKILAIETSCDETALAFVEASGTIKSGPKFKVLANLISSQIEIHRPFGGVVPNLAKREHIRNLPILLKQLEKKLSSKSQVLNPDLIAVTVGPGLEPALWTGINFAVELGKKLKKPVMGTNHLEGHLYSFLLSQKTGNSKSKVLSPKLKFPAIVLSVSGGHTMLLSLKKLGEVKKIGETLDDAVGEAFDKVARLLELPYPGGPEIEKLAKKGNENAIDFPRPMIHHKNYDFSFSGLKTSVLYYIRDNPPPKRAGELLSYRADLAASFQKAAVDVLVKKATRAAEEFKAKSIVLVGGVSANKYLQKRLSKAAKEMKVKFFSPPSEFNTDNAAMIAAAAYIRHISKKKRKKYPLKADGNIGF